MSRFSPTVLPTDRNPFADALRGFIDGRTAKRERDEREAAKKEEQEYRDLTLAKQGIYRGTQPMDESSVVWGQHIPPGDRQPEQPTDRDTGFAGAFRKVIDETMKVDRQPPSTQEIPSFRGLWNPVREPTVTAGMNTTPPFNPAVAAPPTRRASTGSFDPRTGTFAASQPSRYRQLTPGYYEDTTMTPEYRAAQAKEAERAADERTWQRRHGLERGEFLEDRTYKTTQERERENRGRGYKREDDERDFEQQKEIEGMRSSAAGRRAALGARASQMPTEGERKGAMFLHKALPAGRALQKFDNQKALDIVAQKAGWGGNWAKSKDGQLLQQAADTWIMAVLRLESGAAIPETEREAYYKTYIPMPGDSEEVRTAKRDARRFAEEALRIVAGRAAPPENPSAGGLTDEQRKRAERDPDYRVFLQEQGKL